MNLQRIVHPSGPVFYVSPLLREAGVPHAFSTRLGGLSPAPFDTLNLGNPGGTVQDDRARIMANYQLLENAAGLSGRERCWLHQVHGAAVSRVARGAAHENSTQGDALVSDDAARVLSVRVADCCPVLLATADGKRVAAIHAGWRGVVAEAVLAALRELRRGGEAAREEIVAAIGPCIGFDAFEVGPEVLLEFKRVYGKDAPIEANAEEHGKGRADIRAGIRLTLLKAGIPPRNIDTTERCTHRGAAEFFSHRRDKGLTGRMAALIGAA